jgi:hypothetical protein
MGRLAIARVHIADMPTIELTGSERTALAAFLPEGIAAARFPLLPRLRPIRSALARIDPQPAQSLRPPGTPSLVLRKLRVRRR